MRPQASRRLDVPLTGEPAVRVSRGYCHSTLGVGSSWRRPVKDADDTPLALEIPAVWLLFLVVAVEMLVTYSRLPARELYHVSGSGLTGGTSRVLVFSNFPIALVAIAVLALLFGRLRRRALQATALAGVVLAAAVFWPGVVDQADLDAKTVNALAALGVLTAVALTAVEARDGTTWSGPQPGDRLRLAVAFVALVIALPWMAAELGFYLDAVPVVGDVFQTSKAPAHVWVPAEASLPSVHHGHHHGMDGVLLLVTAALLSRVVPSVRDRGLRVAVGMYLALMASYGIANIANDAWGEQVVKRAWTTWRIPSVLRPDLTIAWGLIILGAAAIYAGSVWWSRRTTGRPQAFLEPATTV
jgi:hypothetical protein